MKTWSDHNKLGLQCEVIKLTCFSLVTCQVYGPPGRLEFQYPIPTPLRYPKPGRSNPIVNVYVSDVSPSSDGRSNLLQV